MRTLGKTEICQVAGGLRPRRVTAAVMETTSTSGQLDISGLGPYETASPLLSTELNTALAQGFTIKYGNDPSSGGSSFDNATKTILIGTASEGNMADTVGQLAHELGHFYSEDVQKDMLTNDPFVYASQEDYITAQLTNEGYAQLNAINVINQDAHSGLNVTPPGLSTNLSAQEIGLVDSMEAAHDSNAAIAKALGQMLEYTDLASGETYHEFYTIAYAEGLHSGVAVNDLNYSGGDQMNFLDGVPVSEFYSPGWTEVNAITFVGPLQPL